MCSTGGLGALHPVVLGPRPSQTHFGAVTLFWCPSQAPLDVQCDLLPPQLRGHRPAVHSCQRRPQTGEAGLLSVGDQWPQATGLRWHAVLHALLQVREMVEIITREFVLMAGTVDVVSTSGVSAGWRVRCGGGQQWARVPCPPNSSVSAGTAQPAGGGPVLAGVPAEEPPASVCV